MKKRKKRVGKKGLALEELGKWIIALAILIVLILGIIILKVKGISILDFIKNLFRFGR